MPSGGRLVVEGTVHDTIGMSCLEHQQAVNVRSYVHTNLSKMASERNRFKSGSSVGGVMSEAGAEKGASAGKLSVPTQQSHTATSCTNDIR